MLLLLKSAKFHSQLTRFMFNGVAYENGKYYAPRTNHKRLTTKHFVMKNQKFYLLEEDWKLTIKLE